ncbi:MAG: hypothetical protein ACOCZ6_05575 [Nanoarchaeota archaeon]
MSRKSELNYLYKKNLKETKAKIKDAVNEEHLIIQSINCLNELGRNSNVLCKRLREWYGHYTPEVVHYILDNQQFVQQVLLKKKEKLLKELGVEGSMGFDFSNKDVEQMLELARLVDNMFKLIESQKGYLEKKMSAVCPNVFELTGALVGAQLLEHAGSLKNLASMTASKIQLLGAEKALFRHLRTGARSPKHGLLIQHPYVAQAKQKGKAARHLADKIAIAARVDYFKGEFVGQKLRQQLETMQH